MRIESYGLTSYKITLESGEGLTVSQEDDHKLETTVYETYIDIKEQGEKENNERTAHSTR